MLCGILKCASQVPSDKNIDSIAVSSDIQSFVKTVDGDFYGYGSKKFFRKTYNMGFNTQFIRTKDIQGNADFIFLTIFTTINCVKEQIDKYVLPMNSKHDYYIIDDVKAMDIQKNLVVFFKHFEESGYPNESLFPLILKNLKTNKIQVLEVPLIGECRSEKVESVAFKNQMIVIAYLDENDVLTVVEKAIDL